MVFDLMALQNTVWGQFAIPFVFIFAVIYGLLITSGMFKGQKNINAIIAAAIALFSTLYQTLNDLLWKYMPIAAGILLALFFIKLILDVIGRTSGKANENRGIISLVVLILIVIVLGSVQSLQNMFGTNSENIMWGIGLIIFAGIFLIASQQKVSVAPVTPKEKE